MSSSVKVMPSSAMINPESMANNSDSQSDNSETVKSGGSLTKNNHNPAIKESEEYDTASTSTHGDRRDSEDIQKSTEGDGKNPGITVSCTHDLSDVSHDGSSSRHNSGVINSDVNSVLKSLDKTDGSKNSADLSHGMRERSFERSLDNILDKCSEKSLELNLSVDSKNGAISDCRKSQDESCSKANKSDKKKKSSAWYTVLSPTYKSRSEDFHRLFKDIPHEERLVVDYSCALQKDILVHGRMFVTQSWVCFYANIFKWETVLTISCKEITGITKEKTARVIPNAIQVTTEKEKYFFTSFGARDKTFMMLFRIWQNALLEQQMSVTELWHWVHYSYGEELGLTSSDEDYISPPGIEDTDLKIHKGDAIILKNADLSDSFLQDQNQDEDCTNFTNSSKFDSSRSRVRGAGDPPTDFGDTTEDSEGEVACTGHEHLEKFVQSEVYHIPVDKLFDLLFTDSQFFRNFFDSRKTYDLTFSPWQEDLTGSGNRIRTISYTLTLSASLGPKTSQTIEKQICYKQSHPGSMYIVDAECTPNGFPYADSFYVVNRYCLTRVTKLRTRLHVSSEVRYRKSVWGFVKNFIEKNSLQGVDEYFQCLGSHLKKEFVTVEDVAGERMSKKKLRKRRTRTQLSTAESLPMRQRSYVAPSTPVRSLSREDKLLKMNANTLVRVVCVVLVLLIMFNALLFYKLWSLETFANILYFSHSESNIDITKYPQTQEEWVNLIKQQQYLHDSEIDKWREILTASITLVEQMKSTLIQLQHSLESRLKHNMNFEPQNREEL